MLERHSQSRGRAHVTACAQEAGEQRGSGNAGALLAARVMLVVLVMLFLHTGTRLRAEESDAAPPEATRDAYVQRLIEALNHDDAYKVRLQAAVLLGRSKDSRAVEPLLAALSNDSEGTVRAAAATALGNLGQPRAISPLMQRLALDSQTFVREAAAAAVRRFPRDKALPYVMSTYGSEDPAVRKQVLLYMTSEPSAMMEPVLISALGDDGEVFAPAAQAVLRMPPEEALHLLSAGVRHRDPSVRRGAVQVLRTLATAEATQIILDVYERDIEVDEVRNATRQALRDLRRYLPLQQVLNDVASQDRHERAHALKLLGVLGGEPAQAAIMQALHADDVYIRGTAVLALGELGDPTGIPPLEKFADDPANQSILGVVRKALKQLKEHREHSSN